VCDGIMIFISYVLEGWYHNPEPVPFLAVSGRP